MSMTGFGRGEAVHAGLKASIELRSINHRFCEIMIRMQRPYLPLEERIRRNVQQRIARGHVDIFVNIENEGEKKRQVKLDKALVIAYYNCLRELAEMVNIDYQVNVNQLAQYPEVLTVVEEEEDLEKTWAVVQAALEQALNQLMAMRKQEGEKIYEDFKKRQARIYRILDEIRQRMPVINEELLHRLKNRLQDVLGEMDIDENRLVSEVVLYAERSSITEEVVRMSSHLHQLTGLLEAQEPVGRRIEFLLQEMNREINTIGSKAADLVISPLVIEVKSELEKIREQVQNVE